MAAYDVGTGATPSLVFYTVIFNNPVDMSCTIIGNEKRFHSGEFYSAKVTLKKEDFLGEFCSG